MHIVSRSFVYIYELRDECICSARHEDNFELNSGFPDNFHLCHLRFACRSVQVNACVKLETKQNECPHWQSDEVNKALCDPKMERI